MDTTSNFGQALKRLRNEKGMTQQALSDASGVSRVEIARLETGERGKKRSPSLGTAQNLAKALGVGVEAFNEPAAEPTAKPPVKKPSKPTQGKPGRGKRGKST